MTIRPRTRKCLFATLVILAALDARAESISEWGVAGDWRILVDADAGNGCLIERTFEDGSRMRIGHLPEREGGFLSVVNKSWTEMTEDENFTVRIDLDDVAFGGEVERVVDGEWRGGYAFFNNPAFVDEFARKNELTIAGPKDRPVRYSLAGSSKALQALKQCQGETQ